jgi:hypothetical protein
MKESNCVELSEETIETLVQTFVIEEFDVRVHLCKAIKPNQMIDTTGNNCNVCASINSL